jgi:hypothetical protein
MTQRRAARWPGRSKMTKANWVGGPNMWLDRTADGDGEKNMAGNMRLVERYEK